MSRTTNDELCDFPAHDTRVKDDAGRQGFDERVEPISEKVCLRIKQNSRPRGSGSTVNRTKIILSALLGTSIALIWLFRNCFPLNTWEDDAVPAATLSTAALVKDAVPVSSPTVSPTGVLECFQVYQPVLTQSGATDETVLNDGSESTAVIAPAVSANSCQILLMEHSFGFSYGMPFVGNYVPPSCKFNRVNMNFTVTSRGRQFDRLAIMYFNDTEVWRTSTAEPTANGIRWEYIKDMTEYMYFWNSPQKLIFDLGNLIDDTYTGPFNTTLTVSFFNDEESVEPASLIIPISARNGAESAASVFMLPGDNATNTISFPRNVNRVIFSVSACGQAAEEFWWSNVLQSDTNAFEPVAGTLYGYSPFREVQVLIDGQLAGVQWPFPAIFTGGVVPGLWRPIVGIDAFDLREHEIDITPWLPILCDGKEHTFEIKVAGIIDDGKNSGILTETVGSSWYVTGKIFVWLDKDPKSITTGRTPTVLLPAPVINLSRSLTQNSSGANETLTYTTDVKRTLSISTLLTTQSGTRLVSWTQNLAVTNYGKYTDFGAVQQNNHTTTGLDQSTGGTYYKSSYSYPLYANTTYLVQPSGNFTIDATVLRGLDLDISGTSVFPSGLQTFSQIPRSSVLTSGFSGTSISTTQNGTAHYFASPSAGISRGYGSTGQEFRFGGVGGSAAELYYRSVEAVNQTITRDFERLVGVDIGSLGRPAPAMGGQTVMGTFSPKEALGRGPGALKQQLVQGSGKS